MSLHNQKIPTFHCVKLELAGESPPAEESARSHLVRRHGALAEEVYAQPWHQSRWAVGSNDNDGRQEVFAFPQQSFNLSEARHDLHQNTNSGQHIQRNPNSESYNWGCFPSAELRDLGAYLPPCNADNAGSLVLDSSRGELVNAPKMTPKEILEAKALAASRSHSEAERRRRERINTHLATLRTIVPSSVKSDKASLLAEVIEQVKKLKRQVSDVYCYGSMPSENDELIVENESNSEKGAVKIRVSMSCDDRPDLMADLKQALDTLGLYTIKVEMSTLGCRMRNDLWVAPRDESGEHNANALIKRVQEAIRLLMERPGRGELLQGKYSKRQRLMMIMDGQQADC